LLKKYSCCGDYLFENFCHVEVRKIMLKSPPFWLMTVFSGSRVWWLLRCHFENSTICISCHFVQFTSLCLEGYIDIDGEDWYGLQTTNLKNLGYTFQDVQTVISMAALNNFEGNKKLLPGNCFVVIQRLISYISLHLASTASSVHPDSESREERQSFLSVMLNHG